MLLLHVHATARAETSDRCAKDVLKLSYVKKALDNAARTMLPPAPSRAPLYGVLLLKLSAANCGHLHVLTTLKVCFTSMTMSTPRDCVARESMESQLTMLPPAPSYAICMTCCFSMYARQLAGSCVWSLHLTFASKVSYYEVCMAMLLNTT